MPTAQETVEALQSRFTGKTGVPVEFRGEWTLSVEKAVLVEVVRFLKEEFHFTFLLDICSVDHFGEEPRYEVVYEFYHLDSKTHVRIKTRVSEDAALVPTISHLYPTANWHEREIYDMMGIQFEGHPDLRRILMWEGYPYFPLRKDFPLEGKPSDAAEVAFSKSAPLDGGPFVTAPAGLSMDREPRARPPEI